MGHWLDHVRLVVNKRVKFMNEPGLYNGPRWLGEKVFFEPFFSLCKANTRTSDQVVYIGHYVACVVLSRPHDLGHLDNWKPVVR